MPSSSKNTADMLSSKCWPVCTITSAKSAASARDSANALTNCGRAPTTVTIFFGMADLITRAPGRATIGEDDELSFGREPRRRQGVVAGDEPRQDGMLLLSRDQE